MYFGSRQSFARYALLRFSAKKKAAKNFVAF